MNTITKRRRIVGALMVMAFFGAAAFVMLSASSAVADDPPRRSGPPPMVFDEFPNNCARCHKQDGRGGPAYGGFAADLRATELEHEGLVFIITEGIRQRGMPEFKSTMSKRQISGVSDYIINKIKGVYFDAEGNQITPEEWAALEEAKKKAAAEQ